MQKANIDKAKMDGFMTGLNWPDAWMTHGKPGGPWVPSKGFTPESISAWEKSKAENEAWLKGFDDGLAKKIATKRVNPLIGVEANQKFHRKNG